MLLLSDEDLPIGCLLTARLLGVIEATQTENGRTCRNDRLIGRVAQSRLYRDLNDLEALGPAFTEEIVRFFTTYNELKGKHFEVLAIGNAERACQLVNEATRWKA